MWQNPLILLPSDAQVVWVRLGTNYGDPEQATYTASTQTFVSSASGLIIPAYMVARWKA